MNIYYHSHCIDNCCILNNTTYYLVVVFYHIIIDINKYNLLLHMSYGNLILTFLKLQ